MHHHTYLQLNIWCNGQCTFQLIWGERQHISAKLPYPTVLMQRYQNWQRIYLHVYPSLNRGRLAKEGSLTPSIDWKHQLQEAEQALLQNMHQWLGGEELFAIREKISAVSTAVKSYKSSSSGLPTTINLLIACDHPQIIRLPWEAWRLVPEGKTQKLIRICRTPITASEDPVLFNKAVRSRSPRILVILANASELNLEADHAAVRSLEQIAQIEFIQAVPKESNTTLKKRLATKLVDDRGWDMLIFAGHSDETNLTGGKIHLAPDISLSIGEIESELILAKQRGLRVAIFNSCSGMSLAQSLIQLGLHQVLVMREQIHDRVAQMFLTQVCKQLAHYQDLHQAVQEACACLKAEKIAYPSAALIPSLFCHPLAAPFQFQRLRWKRLWLAWKPTRSESITVAVAILFSLIVPMQDLLLEIRIFNQAVYRDQTRQFPQDQLPPVQLIAIDRASINRAIDAIEGFEVQPMDRRYLAQVVNRLAQQNTKTIGIDYEIYTEEPYNEALKKAVTTAVKQNTWFIFAVDGSHQQWLLPKTASPNWSLQGNIFFSPWFVEQPDDLACQRPCPFAYLVALSHRLKQSDSLGEKLQPSLDSQTNFQEQITQSLQDLRGGATLTPFKQAFSPLPWPSAILDFSIPPQQVYHPIPAWELLQSNVVTPSSQAEILPPIALIASGEYEEAEDSFSMPLAIAYWCRRPRRTQLKKDCPGVFTGGQAHAYMVRHLLKGERIILIPDVWMIGLAAILGKWITLILLQQEYYQRRQKLMGLSTIPLGYGMIGLQLYISASLSIPWFWPSIIFWQYLLFVRRKYVK